MYEIRKPKFLSPSSIKIFEHDLEDYCVKYLLKNRPPRPPQTQPMSVGSAFDAFAKSHLYYHLFGNYGSSEAYRKEVIFESQVEVHNRDWALKAGQTCFDGYKKSGALIELIRELDTAVTPPQFEFTVEDYIEFEGFKIPLLGKPDISFMNDQAVRVVYDWKVNGFCAVRNTSPMKGYVHCRDLRKRTCYSHKNAVIAPYKGVNINVMMTLEDGNKEWADQLSIYSWLLGEPVGSENVVFGIDQITGPGCSRISSHRLRIKPDYQMHLAERAAQIWEIVDSGHIFRTMTREESDAKLQQLEDLHVNNPIDTLFSAGIFK